MENITLGWLKDNLAFLIAFIGCFISVYMGIKKAFNKGLEPINIKIDKMEAAFDLKLLGVTEQLDTMQNDTILKIENIKNELKKDISETDMNATKNYLVTRIQEFKSLKPNKKIDAVILQRFWEQYEYYIKHGGNSYIKHEVEDLEKNGIL